MLDKPFVEFEFTYTNEKTFTNIDVEDIIYSDSYSIPDYWFEDENKILEFSRTLKENEDFIDYFQKLLEFAIIESYESFLFLTLRTNYAIIFISVSGDDYGTAIDKLIELNINLERYERCAELSQIKSDFFDYFIPVKNKSTYLDGIIFWGEYYKQ